MHYQGMSGLLRRYADHSTYDFAEVGRGLAPYITMLTYIAVAGQVFFFWNLASRACCAARRPATTPGKPPRWTGPAPRPLRTATSDPSCPSPTADPYDYDPGLSAGEDFASRRPRREPRDDTAAGALRGHRPRRLPGDGRMLFAGFTSAYLIRRAPARTGSRSSYRGSCGPIPPSCSRAA